MRTGELKNAGNILVILIKFCYVTLLQKNDDTNQNPLIIKIVKSMLYKFKYLPCPTFLTHQVEQLDKSVSASPPRNPYNHHPNTKQVLPTRGTATAPTPTRPPPTRSAVSSPWHQVHHHLHDEQSVSSEGAEGPYLGYRCRS